MTDEPNSFRVQAQARKAAVMAEWLRTESRLRDDPLLAEAVARKLDDAGWWHELAKTAPGVNATDPPSPVTRAMTVGFLQAPALTGLRTGGGK